ncbi:hypothetical protein Y032_0025g1161 [Ancylostoma ceylanicum]|uniref:Amino acid transporter transmembrane domain-containing protein n=1 Tax=Ancylostoma ceylanicum TaxID=53326 RepID=A0A016UVS4_9BILA|nr:hypothetical protein Y032_0025g1161 [Ancylostoma ceylanicum]
MPHENKSSAAQPSEFKTTEKHENTHGLHWAMAAVFIVGDMAGGGMIAMPNAVVNAGLIPGVIMISLCAACSGYTGLQLASNWTMMQRRWPKYRDNCRKPYGEMAYRANGPRMRSFIAFMICLTQFGFATVLILLAAKNMAILLHFFFTIKINYCWLILIVGLIVWPATMLKSPMHFWQVAVFSALSSSVAVCLLLIGFVHDAPVCGQDVPERDFNLQNFFMAYGTMVFAFGGHAVFPTIQHDMKKPRLFSRSVLVAYVFIVLYYMIIAVGGNLIYGATVGDAIIPSVQLQWVQQAVNLMIALHVITTIVIVFSPMTQQIEDLLRIPHHFGWQRFLVRSLLFWTIIFVALSLPNFGPLLDLIGASNMSIMTMIMPSIFFLFLNASEIKREKLLKAGKITDGEHEARATISDLFTYLPRRTLIINGLSLSFGILGGLVSTIFSIVKMGGADVSPPCYIQYVRQGGLPFVAPLAGTVNCCGTFRNITVSSIDPVGFCAAYTAP